MKLQHLILFISISLTSCISIQTQVTQSKPNSTNQKQKAKTAIKKVLQQQEEAWNKGDLKGFMEGYHNSDSLKFYGKNGLTKGWQNTLNNYLKSYPTKAKKGQLTFTISDISAIETNSYWVMGQYQLIRHSGNANGVFMLIFKHINGAWKIVADLSC